MKPARRISPAAELQPGRRRLFLAVTILFPLLVAGLLEAGLRLAGYGPDLSLFTTEYLGGRPYLVMNAAVKGRYFARVPFSPSTSPDYFPISKPPGTFRIFCLGGSTTVGYPYWYNGSFSSFLRDRLQRLFPDRTIEVINLGMTATNSFTVNDMAREVVDYDPDLLIVYDGHNEFYGALGVASNESPGRARWISRLALRAVHLKTFLLLRDLWGSLRGLAASTATGGEGATMMERLASGQVIASGSDVYRAGLETYVANLAELKELAASREIPVLLGSQVSNLRDLPPFVSEYAPDVPEEARSAFSAAVAAGEDFRRTRQFDSALTSYAAATALDPQRADAHFRVARCLDTLGRQREAERSYLLARDNDQLRFRMNSEFNAALGAACTTPGFLFVDMEKTFRDNSPDSLIGSTLIVEHLHPNARGYFLMARAYAERMRAAGVPAPAEEWQNRDTLNEDRLWNERCLTEIDERMAARRTEILLSGWPFRSGVPLVNAVAPEDTLGQVVEKVTRGQWNWLQAHNAAAAYYLGRGELPKAEVEYLTIINQLPLLDVAPYLTLAKMYVDQSRIREARRQLEGSLRVKPTILAYRALGDIALREGRAPDAAFMYEKTFTFPQAAAEQVQNGYLLALALSRSGRQDRASSELLKILSIRPDYQPAAELLAKIRAGGAR